VNKVFGFEDTINWYERNAKKYAKAIARTTYPEIKFVEGNFLNLPFADQSFDGIWAHASLLHLETVKAVEKKHWLNSTVF